MKASNQGFVDLHTPQGFFLIGICFLLFSFLIIIGSVFAKQIAAKEKQQREDLRSKRSADSKLNS